MMDCSRFYTILFSVLFYFSLLSCIYFDFSLSSNATDKEALLHFKSLVTHDPFSVLSTWNHSLSFCKWYGVTCSSRHPRVVSLDLKAKDLSGSLTPFIGNLSFLRSIDLRNNSFVGEIPQEIGNLFRLQSIRFSINNFQGEIPSNLTRCPELRILDLVMNKLVGQIPPELGALSKLLALGLAVNNLTGSIPPMISNLSSLQQLSLSENSLHGNIPIELGQLKQLSMLQLSSNKFLTGSIPAGLFNITTMKYFALTENQLMGEIPPYIGLTLPNLRIILLGGNHFTGSLPHSLSNATSLEQIDFSFNKLTGSVPEDMGSLKYLTRLNIGANWLGLGRGNDLSFLNSLVNCTQLRVLALNNNSLSGVLPTSIANLSANLNYLFMGANNISGIIPSSIHNLRSLQLMAIEDNLLTGVIPVSLGYLSNLEVLSLFGNRLSGEIPSSLGNASLLTEISLDENVLQGSIPSILGSCPKLGRLGLSANELSGSIPIEVIGLSSLSEWLDLSQNMLVGPLPAAVGNLRSIQNLDLSDNHLSGEISDSIRHCVSMEQLNLHRNFFSGSIPSSLRFLRSLHDLDISHNNFSGLIPRFLGTLPFLVNLNLSYNNLEGEVPKEEIFGNTSAFYFVGNDKLCGGYTELHLQNCVNKGTKKFWQHLPLAIVIPAFCLCLGLITLGVFSLIYWRRRAKRKPSINSFLEDKYMKVSYADLYSATDGFSPSNLIGKGSYGTVYKGNLRDEVPLIAVKVFDLLQRGASRSFLAECEVLRCIQHRNLLKVITCCSSLDFRGNEFKALVFEFMPNGSLENWLHKRVNNQTQRRSLNLVERLSIAIEVAQALNYLHHGGQIPIVHCDLKPSNILLDDELTAYVGDFGLSRLLDMNDSRSLDSLTRFKGSIGYVAPEYGQTGKVSTYADVYSYGILLLEMFTGKCPTDDMFKDGFTLHDFAKAAIPERILETADPTLFENELPSRDYSTEGFIENTSITLQNSLVSIFRIGVLCSSEMPRERLQMQDVIVKLQGIRDDVW